MQLALKITEVRTSARQDGQLCIKLSASISGWQSTTKIEHIISYIY